MRRAEGRRLAAEGFTLIELMVVVAIVGILASVAIPSFGKLLLRAKSAERTIVMRTVVRNIQDLYVQQGYVTRDSVLVGTYNPGPYPPTMERRPFDRNMAAWSQIFRPGDTLEGSLYYSYRFIVWDLPGFSQIYVEANGDLDGDGTVAQKQYWYLRQNGVYQLASEWPAEGAEDQQGF